MLIREHVKLVLEHIGEGYNGDYDPDDPEDAALLRLDVYRRVTPEEARGEFETYNGWYPMENGSYCTDIPDTISVEQMDAILGIMMDGIFPTIGKDDVVCGKHVLESVSQWNVPPVS